MPIAAETIGKYIFIRSRATRVCFSSRCESKERTVPSACGTTRSNGTRRRHGDESGRILDPSINGLAQRGGIFFANAAYLTGAKNRARWTMDNWIETSRSLALKSAGRWAWTDCLGANGNDKIGWSEEETRSVRQINHSFSWCYASFCTIMLQLAAKYKWSTS